MKLTKELILQNRGKKAGPGVEVTPLERSKQKCKPGQKFVRTKKKKRNCGTLTGPSGRRADFSAKHLLGTQTSALVSPESWGRESFVMGVEENLGGPPAKKDNPAG